MDPDTLLSQFLPAVAVLLANALFTAAEFALLFARPSRIEQQARESARVARRATRLARSAESLAMLAQLGRSTTALALGAMLASWAITDRAPLWAVVLAAVLMVLAHTVVGYQLPRLAGAQRAEPLALRLASLPVMILEMLLRPLIWLANLATGLFARPLGLVYPAQQGLAHTPEEIQQLVAEGHEQGVVEEDEREMIESVFEFSGTVAREVMTPRIDVVAVPVDVTLPELVQVVVGEGYSRIPVYEDTIDTIVGVLLSKDLILALTGPGRERGVPFDVRALMREPYFVPDTKPVDDILAEFRQQSIHLAIVLDEYGGTAGVVTMEDLLEEIVGEIHDEHDVAEQEFAETADGDVLIDGGAAVSEVNERFGLNLPEEDFDTVGGFVFGSLGRVPEPGDEVAGLGTDRTLVLCVEEIEDRRILRVRLTRAAPAPTEVVVE